MLFLMLGVVCCFWLFWGFFGMFVFFFVFLGGFLVVYYVYYLIIMGLGLYLMVEFFGVCDIWFVEILNINLRNVIKNLFIDYLF